MPHADEVLTCLDEVVEEIRPFTYVVVTPHGNYDELALEKILPANPTYIGLVASPKRAGAVRHYLAGQGISETEMLPLKAPAGPDIQARRGDEIALSIMAEIIQKRRIAELLNLELFQKQADVVSESIDIGHMMMASPKGETAVDPICHMHVEITTAKYTSQYEGTTYYFCCPGCKSTFEKDPAAYAGETTTHTG